MNKIYLETGVILTVVWVTTYKNKGCLNQLAGGDFCVWRALLIGFVQVLQLPPAVQICAY